MKITDKRKELINIYGISDILTVPRQPRQGNPQPNSHPAGLENLRAELLECRRCKLSETRTNVVFGEGNINAELMFIGEGPGKDEDRTGRPFVGRAGQLLTGMIEAMKYKREEVYIANIVKCRPAKEDEPSKDRPPHPDEVYACIGFLYNQIEMIRPKVIVCLGSVSAMYLLKMESRISNIRGKFYDYRGIKVMPTFHPSYLLRNEAMQKERKRIVWGDLKLVMAELNKI